MQQTFDVFLNFRGDDVRRGFLSYLLGVLLNQTSLQIFVDSNMRKGDEISLTLMSAIENSKLAITIFSKNYAASPWCLNELVKIIECRENPRIKQKVIPVFYLVTSADVTSQSGSFTEAFTAHENSKYDENREKVPKWKAAMKRAGDFPGTSVTEKSSEYDAVVNIVNGVLKALGRPPMENKVDGPHNSVRLTHTLELQVKGNMWSPSSSSSTSQGMGIESLNSILLSMLKLQAHPSSSLPLKWNPQTNSSYSQVLTYEQTEGSTEWKPQTNSSNSQAPKYGHSEGSKSTETSSGPATEWKSKASTYGQSEGSKSTGTSSASAHNTSYPTTGELYLPDARGKVVLFVISSGIDKVIAENCDAVREVLEGYGVSFDERNTSMTSHRKELQDVLKGKPMKLPALFVKGDFIGGYEEIELFKESGKLAEILEDFCAGNREWSYKLLDPKYGHSEWSKSTETSSGPATEWKSKASAYGRSEGSKSTGTSSASVQNTSYPTTGELYLPDARDKVVLFVTSSGIDKVIAEHCDAVREVLEGYGVSFDERNTSITSHRKELQDVLKGKPMKLPALFVKGDFIGGYEEIELFKESGKLAEILEDFCVVNRQWSYKLLDPKYGHSEGSKSTETSSGPAIEWKSKVSTYGQSEGSKSTGTSSASVQNTSYLTAGELYLPEARDKVVLFVRSSRVDKVIAEHCDAVREVLEGYGVSYDERNISMTSNPKELQDVLKGKPMKLPALFVRGDFIGGYEEIKKFKESGELAEILQDFSSRNRISYWRKFCINCFSCCFLV